MGWVFPWLLSSWEPNSTPMIGFLSTDDETRWWTERTLKFGRGPRPRYLHGAVAQG